MKKRDWSQRYVSLRSEWLLSEMNAIGIKESASSYYNNAHRFFNVISFIRLFYFYQTNK